MTLKPTQNHRRQAWFQPWGGRRDRRIAKHLDRRARQREAREEIEAQR